ncbi:MAG: MraY family glycosyltransferase [Alistipes sp.]
MIGRVAIPRIILIAKRKRIFDTPNPRKIHTQQIPRLGGVSFLPGMLIAYFLIRGIQCTIGGNGMPDVETIYQETIFYFFTGLITIAAVGLWDDIIGLTYKYKLLVQLFVALLLVLPGTHRQPGRNFRIYAIPDWMSTPLTVLIVMVVINAFNLIDGMDGLCSGLSIVTLLTLTVLLVHSGNPMLALLSASTVGVVAAFFRYNYFGKRLKVFMGDCGSLTLGYITAFLLLQLASANNGTGNSQLTLVTLMSIIFIPLFDTTRLFIQRICLGHSPFCPDKNHIHHKFLQIGCSQRQSFWLILCIQIVYIIANFLLAPIVNINVLLFVDILSALALIFFWTAKKQEKSRAFRGKKESNQNSQIKSTKLNPDKRIRHFIEYRTL